MTNFTPELIAKAKAAKSAEELFSLAKANGAELTEAEVETYFAQLNANGAVVDDELDVVAGGGSCPGDEESAETTAKKGNISQGSRVRVTDGSMCSKCNTNYGVIKYAVYGSIRNPEVRCSRCGEIILDVYSYRTSKVELV